MRCRAHKIMAISTKAGINVPCLRGFSANLANFASPNDTRMQLSILIPVYNFCALQLVKDLKRQAERLDVEWELIVVDDASQSNTEWMTEAGQLEGVSIVHNPYNLGRAANRNKMVEVSSGEWLIMIDSDAQVITDDFVQRFLDAAPLSRVICGRVVHPDTLPSADVTLRWTYEKEAERRMHPSVLNRQAEPPFRTFACMIHRSVFRDVRFEDSMQTFGFDDTLFGIRLYEHGYKVHYIDNPLLNVDLEPNPVYLAKVEESIRTLRNFRPMLEGHTRQLRVVRRVEQLCMGWLMRYIYKWFAAPMRRNLLGLHPSLTILNIYKLTYWFGYANR